MVAFVIIRSGFHSSGGLTLSAYPFVVSASSRSTASEPSRRSCLKLGVGAAALSPCPIRTTNAQPLGAIRWLDGDFLVDASSRSAVATDYGGAVRRTPRALVRARTAE